MNVLTQTITAVILTLALLVYDKVKKQVGNLLKYCVSAGAIFALPYLLHWKYAFYLEAAGIWLLCVLAWSRIVDIATPIIKFIQSKVHK